MAVKKWSAQVETDSTHPDEGLFKKDAAAIAKALMSKKVSPKGPASGMRMLNFYINRAGKTLTKTRVAELEKAKRVLSGLIAKAKDGPQAKVATKASAKKAAVKKASKKTGAKKTGAKKTGAKKIAAKKTSAKKAAKKASVKKKAIKKTTAT